MGATSSSPTKKEPMKPESGTCDQCRKDYFAMCITCSDVKLCKFCFQRMNCFEKTNVFND